MYMNEKKHIAPGVYTEEILISKKHLSKNKKKNKFAIDIGRYDYTLDVVPRNAEIERGKTLQLKAIYKMLFDGKVIMIKDVTEKCRWYSDIEEITVDNDSNKGLVTVLESGAEAIIRAEYDGIIGFSFITGTSVISHDFETTPSILSLTINESKTITATYYTVIDGKRIGKNVTSECEWKSNNSNITVSKGKVTAKKTGAQAIITATYNGMSSTTSVEVESVYEYELVITSNKTSLNKGNTANVVAIYYTYKDGVRDSGKNVTNSCVWSSSNSQGISVSNTGVVTAIKSGVNSTISATYNGKTSNNLNFTVDSIKSYSLIITPYGPFELNVEVEGFDTCTLTATYISNIDGKITEENVTNTCNWSTTNTGVTITNGVVKAIKSGTIATISASYNGVSSTNTVEISVASVIQNMFKIPKDISELTKGDEYQLKAQFVTTTDGVVENFYVQNNCTWVSDNSGISVSTTGKITALTPGATATITATYVKDGKTYTDSITIKVKDEILYYFIVTPENATIEKGETLQLASVFKIVKNGNIESELDVAKDGATWTSSNSTNVSVGQNTGIITGNTFSSTAKITASFTYLGVTYTDYCNITVKAEPKIPIIATFNVTGGTQFLFPRMDNIESVVLDGQEMLVINTIQSKEVGEHVAEFTLKDQSRLTNSIFRDSCITSITIPDELAEKITLIQDYAFYDCTLLETFTIPKNVKQMGGNVFEGCSSLTSVVFENETLNIPNNTCKNCSKLTNVILPTNCETIGNSAFEGCRNLGEIVLSKNCVRINDKAFYGCSDLTTVEFSNTLQYINVNAFGNCSSLDNVNLPDTIISIGNNAFDSCNSLSYIDIPSTCTTIGDEAFARCRNLTRVSIEEEGEPLALWYGAFWNCESLPEITIPDRVTSIGDSCFYECKSLVTVKVPNELTVINQYVFYNCIKLVNISLPSTVKSIKAYAFYNCESLPTTENIIVHGVTSIGTQAFYSCDVLNVVISDTVTTIGKQAFTYLSPFWSQNDGKYCKQMYVDTGNTAFTSRHADGSEANCIMTHDRNTLLFGCNDTVIPDDVKIINAHAFYHCNVFSEKILPDGLTSIGESAFEDCTVMKQIVFPETLLSIGNSAFSSCNNLTEIHIPKNVNSIGSEVFKYCTSLEKISVDENNITYDSRNDCNCIMQTNNSNLLYGCHNTIIPSDTRFIHDSALYSFNKLSEVTFPETLEQIGDNAFYACTGLTEIYIPKNVNSIGDNSFRECANIILYDVDGANTDYSDNGNNSCIIENNTNILLFAANIEFTEIPSSVTKINDYCFYNNTQNKNIIMHNNVSIINSSSFRYNTNLKTLILGSGLTKIEGLAFDKCENLSEITVLANKAPILNGYLPFNDLPSIGTIYYPKDSDYSSWKQYSEFKNWEFIEQ